MNSSRTMPDRRCRAVPIVLAVLAIHLSIAAGGGASAQSSNAAPGDSAEAEAGDFYRVDRVQTIHLQVGEEDLQRLLAALPQRIFVRASFRWRDVSIDNVAIRFKGNSSSAPAQQHKMEVDDFLSITAVMLFSGAFDQLTGWNPHNYYLYFDTQQECWRYLPWDLDVGFCEITFGQIHVLANWNAVWPAAGQLPNPLLDRIVADPVLLKRYRDTAREILEKYFEPERLCALIDARYAMIKDDLAADPFPHRRVTNPEDQSYDDIAASMKIFVRNRYVSARQQLEHPGTRPEMVRRPVGPGPRLAGRIQRIVRAAQDMQRRGEDVLPIQKLMQRVGPLLQQGQVDEAEKLILEALKLAGEDPGADNEDSPPGE
ncbi:MAG: CotH kinase family protein [Planctomycetales bacterium]